MSLRTNIHIWGMAWLLCGPQALHAAPPDISGIWQALSSAYENIEPHAAHGGASDDADAFQASRGGLGVVEGGAIPYTPAGRATQLTNFDQREDFDPARNCYLPGVPRANYMPYPLQIVQTSDHVFIAYEFAQASRTIYLDQPEFEAPVDSWMGHSLGRWREDTLVVDVTDQVADTWLDRAGNHHSGALRVEERYRLEGPDHLRYTAILTDAATYTRPWTLSVLLYRVKEPRAQLLDFKCVEFVEERMYGHLSKQADAADKETN
ncbi:MAG: hypothetical protein AAF513_05555 [Pseudomonadota bacterium]